MIFIPLLLLVYLCGFLVAAVILKKYQRTILWAGALILFFSIMLLIGLGIFLPRGYAGIFGTFMAIIVSGALVWTAEKLNSMQPAHKVQDEEEEISEEPQNAEKEELTIELPAKLDTVTARRIFKKAIHDGFMEEHEGQLKWNKSAVLLAYMCGRIYCDDKSQYYKRQQKYLWRLGDGGRFPDASLQSLFGVKNLGLSRQKNKDTKIPDGAEQVDRWF